MTAPQLSAETVRPSLGREGVFISNARLAALRGAIAARDPVVYPAALKLREAAEAALASEPSPPEDGIWRVPGFYQDKEGHRQAKESLKDDANCAYTMALMYRITGDARYGEGAKRNVLAWTRVRGLSPEADSPLAFSYHFPSMIFAAGLLRGTGVWDREAEERFRSYLERIRSEYRRTQSWRWPTWTRENNWGNWGMVLGMSAAVYLDDREWFDAMVERWKLLLDRGIDEKGEAHHEVRRNHNTGTHGIWYTHFTLHPQTLGAEIARLQGVDLYGYTSPSGRSLRQAYETLIPWVDNPRSFPYFRGRDLSGLHHVHAISYFELLQTRWPDRRVERLLQSHRPLDTIHSSPHTTATHGALPANL